MAKRKTTSSRARQPKFSYERHYREGGQTWAHEQGGGWCVICRLPALRRRPDGTIVHFTCDPQERGARRQSRG